MNRKIFFTFVLIVKCFIGFSQILDDSTKQVYSIKTVKYILEDDILNNKKQEYHPDTTFNNFHWFDSNLQGGWLHQDLGNIGTAIRPLFYEQRQDISQQLGFNSFSFYAFDPKKIQYFNSKSPYTGINYVQSGGGTALLGFKHSQNINPQFNMGLDVRHLTTSKQFGAPKTREDRLSDSWNVNYSINYISKNQKYTLLGNYNHFNHYTLEQGGIKPVSDSSKIVETQYLNDYKNYLSKLSGASARDWRNEFHLYQQFKLANGFQLYYIADYQGRRDLYFDNNFGTDSALSSQVYHFTATTPNDSLSLKSRYRLLENKFGIKGIYRGFAYRLNLRQRNYTFNKFDLAYPKNWKNETYLGAWANYFFPDSIRRVYAETELGTINSIGNLKIKAEYLSPSIRTGFTLINRPADILDQFFYKTVALVDTNLTNEFSMQFYANTDLKFKNWIISPNADYSIIKNYIYYDENALVKQLSSGAINILKIGLNLSYQWKQFAFNNQSYWIANSRNDLIRMPKWTNNTQISVYFRYAKILKIQTGVDIFYRSSYRAYQYMPLIRQFYLQNEQSVWGTPIVDIFANLNINKVRLFFKFAHVNQGFPANGYYVSPNFPGLKRTFFLGVNWPLFD